MEKKIFNSEWLVANGFVNTGKYDFARDGYTVRFTPAGCHLLHDGVKVTNFNGYIDDLIEIWPKYTGRDI